MEPRLDRLSLSIERHGLARTLVRAASNLLRRLVYFEICRVESSSGQPYDWPDVPGYETRAVDRDEFSRLLCGELAGRDYDWAFRRGDLCAASLHEGRIVGYSFPPCSPRPSPTACRSDFPAISFTASPPTRYPRIAAGSSSAIAGRWPGALAPGREPVSIWYINVTNLESMAANRHAGVRQVLHGYAGFARLLGRWVTVASRGCRRLSVGFARQTRA